MGRSLGSQQEISRGNIKQEEGRVTRLGFSDKIITTGGRQKLDAQIGEWRNSLADLRRKSPDRDARNAGNTGSGSKMQDEATRQHNIVRSHIDRLTRLRSQAKVAPEPTSKDTLRIGATAVFVYHTTAGGTSRNVRKTYEIVGFEEGDCDSVPRRISYETPLAQAFLGATIGTRELVFQDGKIRTLTLAAIQLPQQIEDAEPKKASAA